MRKYANRGRGWVLHKCKRSHIIFLIEYLVHKLLTTVTRFFVSFIKIPVLLKISVLKNYISFVPTIISLLRLLQKIN